VNLKCPVCGYEWQSNYNLGTSFSNPYDFNQLVSFPIPVHTSIITHSQCLLPYNTVKLYLAVHSDGNGNKLKLQRSNNEGATGISADWWQHERP
jgi:hypothetical protein